VVISFDPVRTRMDEEEEGWGLGAGEAGQQQQQNRYKRWVNQSKESVIFVGVG